MVAVVAVAAVAQLVGVVVLEQAMRPVAGRRALGRGSSASPSP
ncbi:hypothetical protein [Polyangium jinanense]|nr:hypothetical protein [Polyangium jinanense]